MARLARDDWTPPKGKRETEWRGAVPLLCPFFRRLGTNAAVRCPHQSCPGTMPHPVRRNDTSGSPRLRRRSTSPLTPSPRPGSQPRQLAFSPRGFLSFLSRSHPNQRTAMFAAPLTEPEPTEREPRIHALREAKRGKKREGSVCATAATHTNRSYEVLLLFVYCRGTRPPAGERRAAPRGGFRCVVHVLLLIADSPSSPREWRGFVGGPRNRLDITRNTFVFFGIRRSKSKLIYC